MSGMFKSPDTSGAERALQFEKEKTAQLEKRAEEERRRLGEQAASSTRARLRGGARMLLSGARLNPEEGITTLGTTSYSKGAA